MAWAEKLPSGRYRGVYRDAAGARRSAGTFPHKAKAERAAAAREETARRRMAADPDAYKRPWGEWCEEWWSTRVVEDSTLRSDLGRRRNHLEPRWGDVPVGSIRRHDVKAWVSELLRGGVSPSTTQRILHLFSASLNAAVDAEVIEVNPAARIKLPAGGQAMERYLTRDEFALLLGQLPTTHDVLVAELLAFTGLRWGELAGLHRNRVDLDRGLLRVVETFDEKAGAIKAYPKGRRVRDVPLTASLVERLRELETPTAAGCGVPHKVGVCRSPLLVAGAQGGVLRNTNWAGRVFKDAVDRAGLGECRIHDLRHTYASWLLQDGVPLAEVGQLLGHVSPVTTQRYAHLAKAPSVAVLAALGGPVAPRLPHVAGGEASA